MKRTDGRFAIEHDARFQPLPRAPRHGTNDHMDKTILKYDNFDEMKPDEYREWQALPGYERLNATAELSFELYRPKEPTRDVQPRIQRTLVHLQRPQS